jgi:hypothetical protein
VRYCASRTVHEYSNEDISVIKKAADLLFNCSLFKDAFPLYELAWKKSTEDPQASKDTLELLIAIVHCAVTDLDMCTAAKAVEQTTMKAVEMVMEERELSEFNLSAPVLNLHACAIQALLLLVFASDARFLSVDLSATIATCETWGHIITSRCNQSKVEFNLLTYWHFTLDYYLQSTLQESYWKLTKVRRNWREMLQGNLIARETFLRQNPGIFALQGGRLKNPCVRDSLNWCLLVIRATENLHPHWENIRKLPLNSTKLGQIALFLHLWSEWNHLRSDSDITDIFWNHKKGSAGISEPEFLKVMAFLIMRESPREMESTLPGLRTLTIPRHLRDNEGDLLRQASAGATALLSLSDNDLANKFLDNYMEVKHEAVRGRAVQLSPSMATLYRKGTIQFVEKALDLNLEELNQHLGPRPISEVSLLSNRSAFAPSLSSSSLSSFRRLGEPSHSRRSDMTLSTDTNYGMDALSDRFSLISTQSTTDSDVDRLSDRFSNITILSNSARNSTVITQKSTVNSSINPRETTMTSDATR